MAQVRQAFCPVCGLAHGSRVRLRDETNPNLVLLRSNFWKDDEFFAEDKPFGVIQDMAGRGKSEVVGYFSPDEDTEGFFPLVKKRLLGAIAKWVRLGWITRAELNAAIKKGEG